MKYLLWFKYLGVNFAACPMFYLFSVFHRSIVVFIFAIFELIPLTRMQYQRCVLWDNVHVRASIVCSLLAGDSETLLALFVSSSLIDATSIMLHIAYGPNHSVPSFESHFYAYNFSTFLSRCVQSFFSFALTSLDMRYPVVCCRCLVTFYCAILNAHLLHTFMLYTTSCSKPFCAFIWVPLYAYSFSTFFDLVLCCNSCVMLSCKVYICNC